MMSRHPMMTKNLTMTGLAGLMMLMQGCEGFLKAGPSAANPEQAAETAYQLCAGCHGPVDLRVDLMPPRIWGQKEKYLVGALTAYRDKTRVHPTMNSITHTFSDQDIAQLARYLSSQPWQP